MSYDDMRRMLQTDFTANIHQEDRAGVQVSRTLFRSRTSGAGRNCLPHDDAGQRPDLISKKLSRIPDEDGTCAFMRRISDITRERLERQLIRRQYNELILQRYRTPGTNALVAGHCNITQGVILISCMTAVPDLLERFGHDRDIFFKGLAC